jgi:hypothetical protein
MKNERRLAAAGLMTLCTLLAAPAYATPPAEAVKPRSQATTIPDTEWATYQKESDHDFVCGSAESGATGYVLIGRNHNGDENNHTGYLCAKVNSNGVLKAPTEYSEHENKLPDGNYFTCPSNEVLTGRAHQGDEREPETLKCGKLVDSWGVPINVFPGGWTGEMNEQLHEFVCPDNSVLIGKYHLSDENGKTRYQCGTLW